MIATGGGSGVCGFTHWVGACQVFLVRRRKKEHKKLVHVTKTYSIGSSITAAAMGGWEDG